MIAYGRLIEGVSIQFHKIHLFVPAPRQFSGFGLRFGLGGVAGDEETSAVVVFAAEGVGAR